MLWMGKEKANIGSQLNLDRLRLRDGMGRCKTPVRLHTLREFCQFPRNDRDPPQRKGLPCRPSAPRRVGTHAVAIYHLCSCSIVLHRVIDNVCQPTDKPLHGLLKISSVTS
jgi:hypothetical protein